jgi:ABC-type amino acid transport substrate-binding protein
MNRFLFKKTALFPFIVCIAACGVFFACMFIGGRNKYNVKLTAEEWQWLSEHDGKILIGADPNYPPLDFIGDNGVHDGMAEDYLKLIERKLNFYFVRANPADWNDLLQKVQSRKIDVIKCGVKTPERLDYLLFTQPYIDVPTLIIVRKDNSGSLNLRDLKGMRVAASEGYSIVEYFRNNYADLKLVLVKNDSVALKMVSSGEADAAISDLPTTSYFVTKLGITNLRIAGETGYNYKLSIASRNDWPILNRIFVKTLDAITPDEQEAITEKWIKLEYKKYLYSTGFWKVVVITAGFVILIVSLYALWNHSLRVLVKERTRELNEYKNHLEKMVGDRTRELEERNEQLKTALAEVRTLSGFLPICSLCKNIRNDKGYWEELESYIHNHSNANFTHSVCPDCAVKLYPELFSGKK